MSNWKNIGTLLLEYGLINNKDLEAGIKLQQEKALRLGEALVQLGKVSMEDIEWILSKQLDVPFVIVEDVHVNEEMLCKFQKDFLIDNRVLPLYETEDRISIVTEDPFNKCALDSIEKSFNKKVDISMGSGRKIEQLLKRSFQKVGLPELVDSVNGITQRIKDTSFYRLDFILEDPSCTVNVFGAGLLKNVCEMSGHFTNEDVFRAFDELNIPFLYEQSFGYRGIFLSIYPLINEVNMITLPAIIGGFGLFRPQSLTFSDVPVYALSNVFPLEDPVQGYPYLSTKGRPHQAGHSVFTIDAAPEEFNDFYVHILLPKKCPSCEGAGCMSCRDLGYEFDRIEGVFSSKDLKERMKEGSYGKD